jgi:hypothetical protein
MSEYMHLVGAEQVQTAANTMREAAHAMQNAASTMDFAFQQQRNFMDDWLQRFEVVLAEYKP